MSNQANVQSVDAIVAVRKALILFVDQVRDALAELDSEMRQMLEWLEHDRPKHWKREVRRSIDQVHEAQQALHRCLMFPIADERPSCYEERAALKTAQARNVYCQEKVERVRKWQHKVQHELFEYKGRIAQLVRLVDIDVPHSIGVLHKIVRHLEDYHTVRSTDPHASYNDLALADDLWPANDPADAEAASAAAADAIDNSPAKTSPPNSASPTPSPQTLP
jgi:exonuclease VII large subunit